TTVPEQSQIDEPPGSPVGREVEEEPPGKRITSNKNRFFSHVPEDNWNDWRWHFRNRITTADELARYIPLSAREKTQIRLVITRYPFAVTPYYLSLVDADNPNDPVRKQAIPCFQEIAMADMGAEDPLEEKRDSVVPGLVHRYPDRVLMVLTDICAMLCRHCTRKREWHNGGWIRTRAEIEPMLDYIRGNQNVRDVIISGGDPLTLNTSFLEDILAQLRRIPHVEIIRIGTRFPVVLPQRIDDELCNTLSKYGPIWLNTHFNHPNEVTPEAARACDKLLRAGVPVSNQTVLLKGINDSVETQMKLSHELLKIKVRPYYLFQCDEVQGTEHLRTPLGTGMKIMEQMRGRTSGLAIPTFVVDLPGGGGKVPIQPNYILSQTEDEFMLRNYEGRVIHFRNPGAPEPASAKPNRRNGNGNHGAGNNQMVFPKLVPLLKETEIN
ncbi:MAG: KamA family radical SAM protein, partial [Chloroflexi bacterium]|nr:KamA family radical SAM protein [Chloroflexota bacterium]